MKTAESLSKSAEASLKLAIRNAQYIRLDLEDLRKGLPVQETMPMLRERLQELTKDIHEFNAYTNARDTE